MKGEVFPTDVDNGARIGRGDDNYWGRGKLKGGVYGEMNSKERETVTLTE